MGLLHRFHLWNKFRRFSDSDFATFLHESLSKKNKSEEELLRYIESTLYYIKFKMPKKPKNMEDITRDDATMNYWSFYVGLAQFYEHILHEFDRLAQLARDERAAENRMFNLNQHMVNLRRLIKRNRLELDMLGYYNSHLQETLVGLSEAKAIIQSDSKTKEYLSNIPHPYHLPVEKHAEYFATRRERLLKAARENIIEWEAELEKVKKTLELFRRLDTDSYKKT